MQKSIFDRTYMKINHEETIIKLYNNKFNVFVKSKILIMYSMYL